MIIRNIVLRQPYRTTPLVQPSVKVITELGIGSYSHLKLQEEICSGAREPQLVPVSPAQANAIKANEFIMKQKVRSFWTPGPRARSPDPSVSIRSLLRPTPVMRSRPAWKNPTNSNFSSGKNAFSIGGQVVSLKPCKGRVGLASKSRFQPKPLLSPNMWRNMLKHTPIKELKKKPVKKREALPEVVLRKERIVHVAKRSIIEEYCDEIAKEGVPGKKGRAKNLKLKTFEGIVGPAVSNQVETLFLQGKRNVSVTVSIKKFEEYESYFTVGDKSNLPPGPCASFTFSLDDQKDIKIPEKTVQSIDVTETVNVIAFADDSMDM